MERECNKCGSTSWRKVVTRTYPERKLERNRTTERVYSCVDCGAQGKRFIQGEGGPDIHSGALR